MNDNETNLVSEDMLLKIRFNQFLDYNFQLSDNVGMIKSVLTPSEFAKTHEPETYKKELAKFLDNPEEYIKRELQDRYEEYTQNIPLTVGVKYEFLIGRSSERFVNIGRKGISYVIDTSTGEVCHSSKSIDSTIIVASNLNKSDAQNKTELDQELEKEQEEFCGTRKRKKYKKFIK